jgi:L-2,4-diaminobutyric acid acetyltransferase
LILKNLKVKEIDMEAIKSKTQLRQPREEDGAGIWNLVKDTGVLDVNSPYSYLMLCKYFSDTCVVAEEDDEIVGFVSAYKPPTSDNVVFVWQVAVAESQRGKGLASSLVQELLERQECEEVQYLEATVSPSNIPSQSLFRGIARKMDTQCEVSECFSEELFPEEGHEPEMTFRIGPLNYK